MARKLTAKQLFEELMAKHEPKLAQAFLEAVAELRSAARLQAMQAALASGDLEAALAALPLNEAVYDDLLEALRDLYLEAGRETSEGTRQQQADFRFSGRNLRAEAWLREYSAGLVSRTIEDQRRAIREHLAEGMAKGTAPRSLAVEIVGRMSRATGRREGGILGLTSAQADYVRRAREELASDDPEALRRYLTRGRRDRRFDRSVAKAIREGRPMDPEIAAKAMVAYERRLLQLRGQTIARTEAMTALHEAQYEGILQQIDAGTLQENQVRRIWRSAADGRVRHTHRALDGESVGLREMFVSPSGATLRFPGDPRAPVAERVNCRCWAETRIDRLSNLR